MMLNKSMVPSSVHVNSNLSTSPIKMNNAMSGMNFDEEEENGKGWEEDDLDL